MCCELVPSDPGGAGSHVTASFHPGCHPFGEGRLRIAHRLLFRGVFFEFHPDISPESLVKGVDESEADDWALRFVPECR